MKNNYLILSAALMVGGLSFGQSVNHAKLYRFDSKVKDAPITTIDGTSTNNTNRGGALAVYYTEDFDAGFNGWVPALQSGNVEFKLTSTGHQNSPSNTYQIPALATSTPTQWVLLDSDADGSSGVNEAATLTSPVIDLATQGVIFGDYIQMEFDQFFPEWQLDECWIGVSTDGSTWTEQQINIGVGREARPNPEHMTWDITDAVGANLSTVQLRFRWVGNWDYGWQIDNVKISELLESDLTIVNLYRNYDEGLMYSQVPVNHSKPMVIGAILKNIGHIQQTGVGFTYEIKDGTNTVVSSGTANADLSFANTELDTVLWETNYTPTDVDTYTVEITAVSTEMDDDASNNFMTDNFYQVTPYTYAMDYPLGTKDPVSNWPSAVPEETADQAMFGNLFYFAGNDVVSALEVEIANNPNIVGETIYTIVGRIPEGGTEWAYDGINEVSVTADDLGEMKTIAFADGYNVNSTDLYLFMIGHYGWGDIGSPEDYFMKQGDIQFNNIQGIDVNSAGRGFFDRKAPIVRLRVNADEVSIEEQQLAAFAFYPNPTADELNITVSAKNEPITIVVRDMAGNLVKSIDLGVVAGGSTTSLDVSAYASGVYIVEMIGQTNHSVKRFVKK